MLMLHGQWHMYNVQMIFPLEGFETLINPIIAEGIYTELILESKLNIY